MVKRRNRGVNKITSRRLIFAALIAVFTIGGAVAIYNLLATEANYTAARQEYADLRQFAPAAPDPPPAEIIADSESDESEEPARSSHDMPDLTPINPDYIGWIRIEGTDVDYPVVQGANNTRYVNITFMGERNPSGAIFMDSRSIGGFEGLSILHGHNMRDGSMFAALHSYLEDGFLDEHPDILIFAPDGKILVFRIFDVKMTNIRDFAYTLPDRDREDVDEFFFGYGIRTGADVLILSTCADSHRNDRLLIFAARS